MITERTKEDKERAKHNAKKLVRLFATCIRELEQKANTKGVSQSKTVSSLKLGIATAER